MIIYFPGCTTSQRFPEIREKFEKILRKLGVEYRVFDELCCGSVLRNTGFRDEFEENRRKLIEKMPEGELIVTGCPGCLSTFREEFPELPEAVHISEFLLEVIDERRGMNQRVAYHDPCHLGRGLGIYDAPRELLRRLGIGVVEMERSREFSWCCGGGGGVRMSFPELSKKLSEMRIREAENLGVSRLVTSCPFCLRNLSEASESLEVRDLIEVVEEALEDD
ncbi:MAG: hypothetical protein PWR13_800 [Archaeoglobi archaeon]|nr:(Fe-S)-binding protein [Candidatus Mnemosynella bozhongmuii]MDI3502450.1 hypothetical protein [Archaeoglobi archaeon]MDK2781772.1 hypothetical protein [Archaeoglobi archaeon]